MKNLLLLCLLMMSIYSYAQASQEQIVNRFRLTKNPKIGRLHNQDDMAFCTATLIGRSCAITAGHCYDSYPETIQFNIPINTDDYETASSMDTYKIDQNSFSMGYDYHAGIDWLIFRTKRHASKTGFSRWWSNTFTSSDLTKYPLSGGYYPGDIQGFYPVSYRPIIKGTRIALYGYGSHPVEKYNVAQKRRIGKIIDSSFTKTDPRKMMQFHNIASKGGDSGSPIINIRTGMLIGVHHTNLTDKKTHKLKGGAFNGPAKDKQLKDAIQDCLDWEKNHMM